MIPQKVVFVDSFRGEKNNLVRNYPKLQLVCRRFMEKYCIREAVENDKRMENVKHKPAAAQRIRRKNGKLSKIVFISENSHSYQKQNR